MLPVDFYAPVCLELAALAAVALLAVSVPANAAHDAIAEMKDQKGQRVGTIVLTQTANGTLLQANFNALPWGAHGFHVLAEEAQAAGVVGRREPLQEQPPEQLRECAHVQKEPWPAGYPAFAIKRYAAARYDPVHVRVLSQLKN